MSDAINPSHYRSHPSGIECIQVTEHMNFNLGNAIKYIWRADEKGDAIENLKKARWYLDREIARRGTEETPVRTVSDEMIGHMVRRFLAWKLPADFQPDAGITFKAVYSEGSQYEGRHEPSGTNLFNCAQAEAMVRHMLACTTEAPL